MAATAAAAAAIGDWEAAASKRRCLTQSSWSELGVTSPQARLQ